MPRHEDVQCANCGVTFECKVGSILICHCSSVQLSESQRELMAQRWDGCLCHDCLLKLQRGEFFDKNRSP